jgi:two-component system, NtrC family, sensor kinase
MNIVLLGLLLLFIIYFIIITWLYAKKNKQIQLIRSNQSNFHLIDKKKTGSIDAAKKNSGSISLEQLVAGIAHEINNPLSFMLWNSQIIKHYLNDLSSISGCPGFTENSNRIPGNDDYSTIHEIIIHIEELLNANIEGIQRLSEITDNLYWFAQKNIVKKVDELYLNDVIKSSISLMRRKIEKIAEIKIIQGDIPLIACNIGEINQALNNLLINAYQAIQENPMGKKGLIVIRTWSENKNVFCSIKDNGYGISKKNLSKIFKPFFSTKAPGDGIGWGLYIAYDIIKNKYNGDLTVESKIGDWTMFTIMLPQK